MGREESNKKKVHYKYNCSLDHSNNPDSKNKIFCQIFSGSGPTLTLSKSNHVPDDIISFCKPNALRLAKTPSLITQNGQNSKPNHSEWPKLQA